MSCARRYGDLARHRGNDFASSRRRPMARRPVGICRRPVSTRESRCGQEPLQLRARAPVGLGSIAELGSWISLVSLLAVPMPPFGLDGVATAIARSSALSLAILVVALLRNLIPRTTARREQEAGATVGASSRDHGLLSALDDRLSRRDSQRSRRALVLLTRSASSAAS